MSLATQCDPDSSCYKRDTSFRAIVIMLDFNQSAPSFCQLIILPTLTTLMEPRLSGSGIKRTAAAPAYLNNRIDRSRDRGL